MLVKLKFNVTDKLLQICARKLVTYVYGIFLLKRRRCLFKSNPGGVYLNLAFFRGPAFINEGYFPSIFGRLSLLHHK